MPNTFRSRVKEIFQLAASKAFLKGTTIEGVSEEAIESILAEIRGIVPDEKEVKRYHPQWECDKVHLTHEAESWNACRQEILKKLEVK